MDKSIEMTWKSQKENPLAILKKQATNGIVFRIRLRGNN
jgi:hypothetical protein